MKKIVSFLLVLFLFTVAVPKEAQFWLVADASKLSDMRAEYEQMEKDLADLKKKLKNLQSKESGYLSQIANYNEQISLVEDEIDAVNALIEGYNEQIEEKNGQIAALGDEIESLDTSITENYEKFKERLLSFHKTGDASTLEILFGSESLADFFNRYAVIKTVTARDQRLLDNLSDEIARQEAQKAENERLREELTEQVNESEEMKKNLLEKQDELKDMKKQSQSLLKRIQSDQRAAESAIEDLDEDMEALEKEIEEATRNSKGTFDGTFAWPLKGYTRVSSGFGYRTHPVTGKKNSFHKGIDLPAPKNTPITAAAAGTVVAAYNTSTGSYGKYVIIDHGGGYLTVYAHCNKVLVKKGDKVTQGQQIAAIGTTGTSTGYHLHFEIRINGQYTDPRDQYPDLF